MHQRSREFSVISEKGPFQRNLPRAVGGRWPGRGDVCSGRHFPMRTISPRRYGNQVPRAYLPRAAWELRSSIPLSPLFIRRFNLAIQPFEPATQVSASLVRSWSARLRAADAVLCEVRVLAVEINEKLVLSAHFGRREYLLGK